MASEAEKNKGRVIAEIGRKAKQELKMRAAANDMTLVELVKHGIELSKKDFPMPRRINKRASVNA
jgi:hypothetical protein